MRYTTLLFDLDHTLFDFDTSETRAFAFALERAGLPTGDGMWERFTRINKALWRRVETGELTPNDVRVSRFARLLDELGIDGDADATAIADDFVAGLGRFGDLYPGARSLLADLCEHAALALVSNGIGEVARAKIARLDLERYFDAVVISGEIGVAKPHRRFFDIAFERLGDPDKGTTLILGDNLISDIRGGNDYGIDTCWYAPNGAAATLDTPTYRVRTLEEIPAIVRR